jgi:RND family efflux transporter MFP subunit
MKTNFVRWLCVLLLLGCATTFVGAWQWRAREAVRAWSPNKARVANKPIPVRTVRVQKKEIQETIGGTAVTLPHQTAVISIPLNSSKIGDRSLKRVSVQAGSEVKRGDVLFEFEPVLFKQLVKQRAAMLSKAQQEHDTMVGLQSRKAASDLQVREAEVAVETAQLELDLAKADLEMCVVKSPIDGVADSVSIVPEMRVPGGAQLAIIHQLDPILVQMDFPMERMDSLSVGETAEIVLDAYPQEKFTGRVTRILPVVSTKTRVLPVILEVPNPDNRIRAGISGFVRLECEKSPAKTVPSVAVIRKKGKAMVFCVEDSRARIREVRTGPLADEGSVAILAGLKADDEVIIHGQDEVQEDDLVNVDWQQWARRE